MARPAKFDSNSAQAIRDEKKSGDTLATLAERYGASIGTISRVVKRQPPYGK